MRIVNAGSKHALMGIHKFSSAYKKIDKIVFSYEENP